MFELDRLPDALFERANAPLLTGLLRGVEKEGLRTLADGRLALSPHPVGLGSALTHPQITTDFSEALLEFITPPSHRIDDVLAYLDKIHRFVHGELGDELLWCHSMPSPVGADHEIPVARYGNSNVGQMKTIYREGLGHRYGRVMQTVAGLHYNFSVPDAFWAYLHAHEGNTLNLGDFRTRRYFGLIRNFRRHYWLLIYLFGASPAVDSSFVRGRAHDLSRLNGDSRTLYKPYATSLRMGDLGYQSTTQESLFVCYNKLDTYLQTLVAAIKTPYAPYEAIGLRDEQGQYRQLNAGLLQIENEFYSAIRPKRTAHTGETALTALCHRGVEYVEVRCLDLDPYHPLGIDRAQMQFLDIFLLYCLLQHSPNSPRLECESIISNHKKVVNRGREPGLMLRSAQHGELTLREWGEQLLGALEPVAQMLDAAHGNGDYSASLAAQMVKVRDPELTPSARVLHDLERGGESFAAFAHRLSHGHSQSFKQQPLPRDEQDRMRSAAARSLDEQKQLEAADTLEFEDYLAAYYEQYETCGCEAPPLTLD